MKKEILFYALLGAKIMAESKHTKQRENFLTLAQEIANSLDEDITSEVTQIRSLKPHNTEEKNA